MLREPREIFHGENGYRQREGKYEKARKVNSGSGRWDVTDCGHSNFTGLVTDNAQNKHERGVQ